MAADRRDRGPNGLGMKTPPGINRQGARGAQAGWLSASSGPGVVREIAQRLRLNGWGMVLHRSATRPRPGLPRQRQSPNRVTDGGHTAGLHIVSAPRGHSPSARPGVARCSGGQPRWAAGSAVGPGRVTHVLLRPLGIADQPEDGPEMETSAPTPGDVAADRQPVSELRFWFNSHPGCGRSVPTQRRARAPESAVEAGRPSGSAAGSSVRRAAWGFARYSRAAWASDARSSSSR
jgi:hypothetical protein